ncbi:hypothetical protein J5N97_025569 [Dioscorea zingiberensis]|uniref:Transcription factor IIIC subunit Tfc1/Sfc1 triple barrel domain-containing protein n=1 Tax=Dioscorea zingiberensis TaxID=325984 RepID=A0A9D5C9P6_9LILI|nr:hypothetical protein J5N97_025569 [Dioscorea zingiberensis]
MMIHFLWLSVTIARIPSALPFRFGIMETGSDSGERQTSKNPQSSSSVIVGGAVAGVLPEAEAFAVHYPGYPSSSSSSRAVHTLGGLSELSKVRSSDSSDVELRFRPEDPYSHPAFASVLARVPRAYHFDGMVDYQHVVAVHAAEARNRKRPLNFDERLDFEKSGLLGSDAGDVIMMVPPFFSLKDTPEKIVLNPSANLFSKNMQRGVVEHRWEHSRRDNRWEWQMDVSKLFDERPIWPRWSLNERLHDDGLQRNSPRLFNPARSAKAAAVLGQAPRLPNWPPSHWPASARFISRFKLSVGPRPTSKAKAAA